MDLERLVLTVRQQLLQVADEGSLRACPYCPETHRQVSFGQPKTSSGESRVVELDSGTVGLLLEHRLRQDSERAQWGAAYINHGLVFAREDGQPIPPETVSKTFVDSHLLDGVARQAAERAMALVSRAPRDHSC